MQPFQRAGSPIGCATPTSRAEPRDHHDLFAALCIKKIALCIRVPERIRLGQSNKHLTGSPCKAGGFGMNPLRATDSARKVARVVSCTGDGVDGGTTFHQARELALSAGVGGSCSITLAVQHGRDLRDVVFLCSSDGGGCLRSSSCIF